jgi:hypothetical protein
MKTTELKGQALDWAVAKCEGYTDLRTNPHHHASTDELVMTPPRREYGAVLLADYCFSTDWAQGGPIIERERIDIWRNEPCWSASRGVVIRGIDGATPLIAAMRCYVASKLGAEVEVPDELKEEK